MAIRSGTTLYYVSKHGRIEMIVTKSDEQSGKVDIEHADGRLTTVNTFNVFRTDVAANIASQNRTSTIGKTKVEYPQFVKDLAK
jgi:hypothetical protein